MTRPQERRGGAPVGFLTELTSIEAASVIYLRQWSTGADGQSEVWNDFAMSLGSVKGRKALGIFEQLCGLCSKYGRRPLMRHSVSCKCLGADESCFANFIATAAQGNREDAMLIATLLVRPDVAPQLVVLATDFGLAFKSMQLCAPVDLARATTPSDTTKTVFH